MSIFGATDIPISDFWRRLLWFSKPEWSGLFALFDGGGQQESISAGCVPPACQLYVFLWPSLDVSTGGVGDEVNKFEQVSSDDHQMSLMGGCPRGRVGPRSGGGLYSEVQYIVDNGHMGPHPLCIDRDL